MSQQPSPAVLPPIARIESFHVGGRRVAVAGKPLRTVRFTASAPPFVADPNGSFHVEQAYVQSIIPVDPVSPLPIVLLHGGGLTGACWETTPDGRPGWQTDFLSLGLAVHVVDGVERGRAGWCALDGVWEGEAIIRSEEEAWRLFRLGAAEDYTARKPFPGQRFPVAALGRLTMQAVPRWLTTGPAAGRALEAVLERVGRSILIVHSQGGEAGFRLWQSRPDLVAALVAVEPSSLPAPELDVAGRCPVLFVMGDYLDALPLWRDLAAATAATIDRLASAGVTASRLDLPGGSHLPMMDLDSRATALAVADWMLGAAA